MICFINGVAYEKVAFFVRPIHATYDFFGLPGNVKLLSRICAIFTVLQPWRTSSLIEKKRIIV